MKPKFLFENMARLHEKDDADMGDESIEFVRFFRRAAKEQKDAMDILSIRFCGYGIGSILNMESEA